MAEDVRDLLLRAVDLYQPRPPNPSDAPRRARGRARRGKAVAILIAFMLGAGSLVLVFAAFDRTQAPADRPAASTSSEHVKAIRQEVARLRAAAADVHAQMDELAALVVRLQRRYSHVLRKMQARPTLGSELQRRAEQLGAQVRQQKERLASLAAVERSLVDQISALLAQLPPPMRTTEPAVRATATSATAAFSACPDASGAIPVEASDESDAIAVAEQYLWGPDAEPVLDPAGRENGLQPGSGTGRETVLASEPGTDAALVAPACGSGVGNATFAVTFDDGTDSASLDFTLYVIKRSDGWRVWGEY